MSERQDPEQLKSTVRTGYAAVARRNTSCCGASTCGGGVAGAGFSPGYEGVAGYVPEADLGLGCGLPTEEAMIRAGESVLDLGSGAGNDVFIAASLVGPAGRVVGLDMTADMVALARRNAEQIGCTNVEFIQGEIEAMPLPDAGMDLVVSNCVLNLVPDKAAGFAEIHRVLKPGGRFVISDVVLQGELPPALAAESLLYVGCVAGAQQEADYLATIAGAGLADVTVRQRREIKLPPAVVADLLGEESARTFQAQGPKILSITVTGRRVEVVS